MKKYLRQLHKINQKIKDPAEFANFESAIKNFLKKTNDHQIFVPRILKALKNKNSTEVSKLIYEIACEMNIKNSFIKDSILKRDFKNSKIRSTVMKYFLKYKISKFDEKIKNKLFTRRIAMDSNAFKYFKEKYELTKDFMFLENEENLFFQLSLMANSHIFYNLSYFIQFLGNNSTFICFKAFEAFTVAFEEISTQKNGEISKKYNLENIIKTDFEHHNAYSSNLPSLVCETNTFDSIKSESELLSKDLFKPTRLSLVINRNSISISNLQNFIVFGACFLKEKDMIFEILNQTDYPKAMVKLYNLISIYFRNIENMNLDVLISDLCVKSKVIVPVENFIEDNDDFSHLFSNKYRKDICDCYEF